MNNWLNFIKVLKYSKKNSFNISPPELHAIKVQLDR